MNGQEFKLIRKFNKISQKEFAEIIGKENRSYIYNIEKLDFVPPIFTRTLGYLLGINLNDKEKADALLQQIMDSQAKQRRKKHIFKGIW